MNKKKISIIIWCSFMAVFFVFLYVLNTTLEYTKPSDAEIGNVYEKAKVVKIISEELGEDPDYSYIQIGKQHLELKLLSGEFKGRVVTAINFVGRVDNKIATVGADMVVSSYDGFVTTSISNYSRETTLYALLFLFVFVLVFFGRMKGIKSIFSLLFTLVCVVFLLIPLIIKGMNPILASVLVVALSTAVTLFSLNGWCKKTMIAGISCTVCTMLAGVIAYTAGTMAHVTTLNTAEAENLLFIASDTALQVKDLLFAGILIATLGAVMDTTMSIASALAELKEVNSGMTKKQLFKSGMNIGKDVMGTMTNTLILAFTGSSINIILIYYMYALPYIGLINLDLLVVEIIQGLSGSIAVILSIPITAVIASRAFTAKDGLQKPPASRTKGKTPVKAGS